MTPMHGGGRLHSRPSSAVISVARLSSELTFSGPVGGSILRFTTASCVRFLDDASELANPRWSEDSGTHTGVGESSTTDSRNSIDVHARLTRRYGGLNDERVHSNKVRRMTGVCASARLEHLA